jgi:DNA-directed RNA polymerase specialized sigma24 family protein
VGVHDRDARRDGRARAKPSRLLLDGDVDGEPVEVGAARLRELEHLTGDLPPNERAAVVLRYGYDLPYDEIGAALGSSEERPRAAASSGVRRLRRNFESITPELDARFRAPRSPRASSTSATT